jgi:hypothetical protein
MTPITEWRRAKSDMKALRMGAPRVENCDQEYMNVECVTLVEKKTWERSVVRLFCKETLVVCRRNEVASAMWSSFRSVENVSVEMSWPRREAYFTNWMSVTHAGIVYTQRTSRLKRLVRVPSSERFVCANVVRGTWKSLNGLLSHEQRDDHALQRRRIECAHHRSL